MKKIILISFIAISAMTLNSCSNGNAETVAIKESISFYEVPLVCGAYAEIGCGSRAKPALLDLEKNPAVREAWLNREGTVFAIVWNSSDETNNVAKPIFDLYEIDYTILKGKEERKNAETFRQENLWYKGTDVDKLSIEEATHIANTLTGFALERNLITQEEANKLKPAIENYFKAELVKVRTPQQLYNDNENKFHNDLVAIATNIIGAERTETITKLYYEHMDEECKTNGSSCTSDSTDACCKKK